MTREPDPTRHLRPPVFPELSLGEYLPAGAKRRADSEPRLAAPAPIAALKSALMRLEETIDQETSALESLQTGEIHEFNRRKSRSLLELSRLVRTLPENRESDMRDLLKRLRSKLVRNHTLLNVHLTAAREIADLMAGALAEAESDGTYGMSSKRRETAP
jgi:flagellar biosynthesis/type III secretory pathway chaperone